MAKLYPSISIDRLRLSQGPNAEWRRVYFYGMNDCVHGLSMLDPCSRCATFLDGITIPVPRPENWSLTTAEHRLATEQAEKHAASHAAAEYLDSAKRADDADIPRLAKQAYFTYTQTWHDIAGQTGQGSFVWETLSNTDREAWCEATQEILRRSKGHPDPKACAEYLLQSIAGLDITDPQECRTPARFCHALEELTTKHGFEFTTFETDIDEMVALKDIPFWSLCRHHVLPFMGVAHIGYIPGKLIAGLSKIARLVRYEAAGLNTQEELTASIADSLVDKLTLCEDDPLYPTRSTNAQIKALPLGVAVVMEAEHTCMSIRGVLAPGTRTSTQAMRGVFSDHTRTAKAEFLQRINHA